MMIARITRTLLIAATALAGAAHAQKTPLQSTLDALDASSAKFTSAQASFKKDLFTYAVKDHDITEGVEYAIHKGGSNEVGIKINGSEAKTVVFKNDMAKLYTPQNDCFSTYSVGNNRGTMDSVLALSFGASGKELAANWNITDEGADKIDVDGKTVSVEKLDLVPRDKSLKDNIMHVELWVDTGRAISLKQVIYLSSRNTQTAIFFNIKLNQSVDKKPYEFKGKPCSK